MESKKLIMSLTKLTTFLLVMAILGCNRLDKQPEKSDKIYNAINYEIEKTLETKKKIGERLLRDEKALKNMEPTHIDYKYLKRTVANHHDDIEESEKHIRYLEVKREKRVDYVRSKTLQAWKKGETWSGDDEFDQYIKMEKIHSRSMNWQEHTPKHNDPLKELNAELREKRNQAIEEKVKAVEARTR